MAGTITPTQQTLKGPDGTVNMVPGVSHSQRVAEDGNLIRQYDTDEVIVKNDLGFRQIMPRKQAFNLQLQGKFIICDPYEPVLVQNSKNSYTFATAKVAADGIKQHKMVLMQPTDQEYVYAVKLALGLDPSGQIKKGEVIQRFGKAMTALDIGAFNAEALVTAAEELVKNLAANKDSGLVTENLPDPATFDGKVRASLRGKREG